MKRVMSRDVPFLTDRQIEDNAESLLGEFGNPPGRPALTAPPVPVDEIIELHLKLTLDIKDLRALFEVGDVHGAIWFPTRRIAVDQSLDPEQHPAKRGRYHFTLAHETGHWRLHRHEYLRRLNQPSIPLEFDAKPDFVCRSSERKQRVEWQADQFAAYVLMPRQLVRDEWEKWHGDLDAVALLDIENRDERLESERSRQARFGLDDHSDDDLILENFCRPFAEIFAVSAEAMRIRLEKLGLLLRVRPATLF